MRVAVNGEERELPVGTTVHALLEALSLETVRVAVERNGELCPRPEHATTELAEGDRVEVVTLVGGG